MASADPVYAGVSNKSCLPLMVRTIEGKQRRLPAAYHLGSEVIELFTCSTPLSVKLILLINVKMPTNSKCGILTLISRINASIECFQQDFFFSILLSTRSRKGYFHLCPRMDFL